MRATAIVDGLAIALVAAGAVAFALGAYAIEENADLRAIGWSLLAIFALRAATSLCGGEAGA